MLWLAARLSRPMGLRLFGWLGEVAYAVLPRYRAIARINLAYAGPVAGLGAGDARRMFRRLGENVFDALRLAHASGEEVHGLVDVHHEERLAAALGRGRGVVAVTAHLGCWELMGAWVARAGYPLHVVSRRPRDPRLNAALHALRARHGVRTLDREAGLRPVLGALRRGEMVALLVDGDAGVDPVEVTCLGRPAAVSAGAARIACAAGAALLPMAIHRATRGRHVIEVGEEVELERGSGAPAVAENARRVHAAMEAFIGAWPEEWSWMRPRWPGATAAGSCLLFLLSLLAAVGGCGSRSEDAPASGVDRGPDEVIERFQLTASRDGRTAWHLEAVRGDVRDRENRVGLREMTVGFFDHSGVFVSKLQADSGSVDSRTEDMEAIGNVRLESDEGSVLRTSRLTWDSSDELLRTDREVEIERGEDVVRGRGFEGDPGLSRFTILEKVSAIVGEPGE